MRLILLEFNELTSRLLHGWMKEGFLPNFSKLWAQSEVRDTECEEREPNLEPWIQWVTVHTGLSYAQHKVFNLGEGHLLKEKRLWDRVSEAGGTVLVCGSMNVGWQTQPRGVVLPDPWTTEVMPHPAELEPYFRFVQKQVTEYTKDHVPLGLSDYVSFLWFLSRRGLSLRTVLAIVQQLVLERLGLRRRWRRAVLLDRLQFDLFRWYFLRLQPDFSTFFLNSTAHFQHFYWRNMEPARFASRPSEVEQKEFDRAVLFGYQQMDRLLGDFMGLAGADTALVFCTALSQQPCIRYEQIGGKVIYRPRDFEHLLRFCGIDPPVSVSPVMAEQFLVRAADEGGARLIEQALTNLRAGGREVMLVRRDGKTVFAGCKLHETAAPTHLESADGQRAAFLDLFYQIEGVKSGMHHPDGMLWVRHPDKAHSECEKMRLSDVAAYLWRLMEFKDRSIDLAPP